MNVAPVGVWLQCRRKALQEEFAHSLVTCLCTTLKGIVTGLCWTHKDAGMLVLPCTECVMVCVAQQLNLPALEKF